MSLLVFSYKFAYLDAFSNLMHFIDSKYMYHDRDHFQLYFNHLSFVLKPSFLLLMRLYMSHLFGTAN